MPPIFPLLQKVGKIPERDMFNTFNMGVGMAVVVPGDRANDSVRILKEAARMRTSWARSRRVRKRA